MKSDEITISAHDLDILLWCASRYASHRRSYTNGYSTYFWAIVNANRDKLNPGRLNFFARDLRCEVSEQMRWHDNIHVHNDSNDRIVKDALTLMCEFLIECPECDPLKTAFDIDCVACTVISEPYVPKPQRLDANGEVIYTPSAFDFYREFGFLIGWVNFADCIDRQLQCISEYQGERHENNVIETYDVEYDYNEEKHINENPHIVKRYALASNLNCSICKEYIKGLKPLE